VDGIGVRGGADLSARSAARWTSSARPRRRRPGDGGRGPVEPDLRETERMERNEAILQGTRPDPPREAWRKQMRRRVLTEARALASENGWDRVRVGDLALRAEVSRPSIYKEFGSRAGIGQALVECESERFLHALAAILEADHPDLESALEAGVAHALREGLDNRFIRAVLTAARGGSDALLPFLTSRPDPVFSGALELLTSWLAAKRPDVPPARAAEAADVAVRLTVSHLLLPSPDGAPAADLVARTVLAVLDSAP
jgi:AcrR family transcriptional regulator